MLAAVLWAAAFLVLAGPLGLGLAPEPILAPPSATSTEGANESEEPEGGDAPGEREGGDAPAAGDEPEGDAAPGERKGDEERAGPDAPGEPEADAPGEPDADDEAASFEDVIDEDERWTPDPATAARLRGRVLSFGERVPLGDARLVFTDGRPAVNVERDGTFSVMLPPGRHELFVRAPGHRDLPATVDLQPRQDLEVELRLDSTLDSDVFRTVVKAERQVAVSSTTLRGDELRRVPGTRGDPLRVVGSLPGVGQLAGFLPYVVVRGAAPGNTGYYLDGTRVPVLFHVMIGPSVIHPYFIDSVDFYPGGAPVRLGRYVSGIIEARTVPARRDRVHGDVDIRLTDAGGLLEIPIDRRRVAGCDEPTFAERKAARTKAGKAGKAGRAAVKAIGAAGDEPKGPPKPAIRCERGPARGALTIAGRYSYTGAILSLVNDTVRIKFWDYQARFDHSVGKNLDFTAFAYGSFDDLGTKETTNLDGEVEPAATFLRFQFHRLDNRLRQRLRNGGSAVYAVVLGVDQAGAVEAVGNNQWRVAPRIDFRVPMNDHLALGFGLDQEIQIFRLPKFDVGELTEDFALFFSERTVAITAGYLELMWQKAGFEARPGVRTDFYVQSGHSPYLPRAQGVTYATGVDPRLLLRERVGPRLVLKQAVGIYHQSPSTPIPIPGIESFGFERGLQRNIQGSFGYELKLLDERLLLQQETYLGRLSNLQDYEVAAASGDVSVVEFEDVITRVDGWAYGLETLLKLDPRLRTFGWIAYTLSRSTRNFPVGGLVPSNWDQRHILNVVLGYKISQKWYFSGRMHYHTGRPWTAPVGSQTALEAFSQNRNNARLPPFFQLDLRVERIWRWPDWQLHALLDVANSTFSKEVFLCTSGDGGGIPQFFSGQLMARAAAATGIARCSEQGFRVTIPSVGLQARW
jgi:hypothetical protein